MMYQIRVNNATIRKTLVLDDSTTIRQAFEEAEITPSGLLSINGLFINANDIDRAINTFNIAPDKPVWISSCTKTENACRITVLGDTVAIKTDISYEDLELIERMNGGLTLVNEEGEEVFKIVTGETGELSKFGMVVPPTGIVNIRIPAGFVTEDERKEFIYDTMAETFTHIRELEDITREANTVEELNRKKAEFFGSINFIG